MSDINFSALNENLLRLYDWSSLMKNVFYVMLYNLSHGYLATKHLCMQNLSIIISVLYFLI
jgi:hypothetical protein